MSNNRDDFSEKTKDRLAKRVGYRCSNPNCRKLTCGASENVDSYVNVGEAAHICAAAPGGKRYDKHMTQEERKSILNGIWLCRTCAKLIDSDELRYTVELLHGWKAQAEYDSIHTLEYRCHEELHVNVPNFSELFDMLNSCDSCKKAIELSYLLDNEIDKLIAQLEEIQYKIDQNSNNTNSKWIDIYNMQFESKLSTLRSMETIVSGIKERICSIKDSAYETRNVMLSNEILPVERRKKLPKKGGGHLYSYDIDSLPLVDVVHTEAARKILSIMNFMWQCMEHEVERYNCVQKEMQKIMIELWDMSLIEGK